MARMTPPSLTPNFLTTDRDYSGRIVRQVATYCGIDDRLQTVAAERGDHDGSRGACEIALPYPATSTRQLTRSRRCGSTNSATETRCAGYRKRQPWRCSLLSCPPRQTRALPVQVQPFPPKLRFEMRRATERPMILHIYTRQALLGSRSCATDCTRLRFPETYTLARAPLFLDTSRMSGVHS